MQVTPLCRSDLPELSQFLGTGFQSTGPDSVFSPEVLAWKYFDGPEGVADSSSAHSTSSLVARANGKIVGHVGLARRQFVVPRDSSPSGEPTTVDALHAIDWLGSGEYSGAGALLLLKAFATSDVQYAVGGTAQARALFPRLGFVPLPGFKIYRKVLNPWHRLRVTGQGVLRKYAGLVRDWSSVTMSRRENNPSVTLRSVTAFTSEMDELAAVAGSTLVSCRRTHGLFNYLLRYPLGGFAGWTIHQADRLIGFAVTNITREPTAARGKIIDCWLVEEATPRDWLSAIQTLLDELNRQGADDAVMYATHPLLQQTLIGLGSTVSVERPVFLRDKDHVLPTNAPFGFSMLDADGAIL